MTWLLVSTSHRIINNHGDGYMKTVLCLPWLLTLVLCHQVTNIFTQAMLHRMGLTSLSYIFHLVGKEILIWIRYFSCWQRPAIHNQLQYIPRNMHTVFALLCFVVVIHWLIFPYPSGLLHWHCGNLTIAPVPAKQPWWIWINTSCEFLMNDCVTTTKQSTTKPCEYFLGYTVFTMCLYDIGMHPDTSQSGNQYELKADIQLPYIWHEY